MQIDQLQSQSISLLQQLISTPSLSRQESKTANILEAFFSKKGIQTHRKFNNIWAHNKHFQKAKPIILLNSHHDTVKPAEGWNSDPFKPLAEGNKLTGLGSNDAGGPLVSLIGTFLHFYHKENLPYNLILAATAEEEISGPNGVASILDSLGPIDLGIVGEPTQMQMAIAEKGLMVMDCISHGRTGHAARNEGINAIYEALPDIEWFRTYSFPKISPVLGKTKMTVSQIEAGIQHNVVPDRCKFVVDIRTTEQYTNREVYEHITEHVKSEVKPRSFRLNSSGIDLNHPIVQKGLSLGLTYFGSPTLSDQSLMPFTTIKIGPGDSARSHTPNEFIMLSEIKEGIELYIQLLSDLQL